MLNVQRTWMWVCVGVMLQELRCVAAARAGADPQPASWSRLRSLLAA